MIARPTDDLMLLPRKQDTEDRQPYEGTVVWVSAGGEEHRVGGVPMSVEVPAGLGAVLK